jgi:hypothetical protein
LPSSFREAAAEHASGRPPPASKHQGRPPQWSTRRGSPPPVSKRRGRPPQWSTRRGSPPPLSMRRGRPSSRRARVGGRSGRLPPASMRRGREIIADEHTETCVRDFRQRAQIYVCEEEVSIAYRYLGAHNSELVSYRRCGARTSAQLGYRSSLSVSVPVSVFNLVATVVITL